MQPRRLDQILSHYGYCSRSEARVFIKKGLVTVKGEPPKAADQKVDPATVLIEGKPIEALNGLLALLYKPAGYVCSHDEREGPNIYGILPPQWSRRNPSVTSVGRLDKDTTGVILVTDDGSLVQRWTSPKHKVAKVYDVTVDRDLLTDLIANFESGTLLLHGEDKPCAPAKLEIVGPRTARLELTEGKYHQVKRMFASQGYEVLKLHRSRFGDFDLAGLNPGEWRVLAIEEFQS